MITYTHSTIHITPEMLQGFFQGWRKPCTPEEHLQILNNSTFIILAVDDKTNRVVGFINAFSDGLQAAFIPLLEVLPEYQQQGIGSELVRRMLEKLKDISSVDLTCDPELQAFYKRFGMMPSVGMIIRNY
jgi:ribosomal protein S18 acetylase RimI-like enzyme